MAAASQKDFDAKVEKLKKQIEDPKCDYLDNVLTLHRRLNLEVFFLHESHGIF